MLGAAQLRVPTVSGPGVLTYRTNAGRQITSSLSYSYSSSSSSSSIRFTLQLRSGQTRCRRSNSVLAISCKSSRSFGGKSSGGGEPDRDYLEAFLLVSETIRHYRLLLQGFEGDMNWKSTQLSPFSVQAKESKADVSSLTPTFLRRFQSPTIFLKISCDGDFLLPIIVGEFAVEKLMDSSSEDESWGCPNQFQLVRNLVKKLGYKVTMVRITERVVNTYFARIILSKHGENDILSVDARPSDAINVAKRCRAPIYVNKQIVLTDGIKIPRGAGRMQDAKSTFDVSLDSAADGPDLLAEELDLVRNMTLAVEEERYSDAAIWRDKLIKLRESRHKH